MSRISIVSLQPMKNIIHKHNAYQTELKKASERGMRKVRILIKRLEKN